MKQDVKQLSCCAGDALLTRCDSDIISSWEPPLYLLGKWPLTMECSENLHTKLYFTLFIAKENCPCPLRHPYGFGPDM